MALQHDLPNAELQVTSKHRLDLEDVELDLSKSRSLSEAVSNDVSMHESTHDENVLPEESLPPPEQNATISSTPLQPQESNSNLAAGLAPVNSGEGPEGGLEPAGVAAATIGVAVFGFLALGAAFMAFKRYYQPERDSGRDHCFLQPHLKQSVTSPRSLYW